MLPVANETDDPITLDQTARFSVSVTDDKDDGVRVGDRYTNNDDEWFETASSEHDATPVAVCLHFAAGDDGDGDVRFGAIRIARAAPQIPSTSCARAAGALNTILSTSDLIIVETGSKLDSSFGVFARAFGKALQWPRANMHLHSSSVVYRFFLCVISHMYHHDNVPSWRSLLESPPTCHDNVVVRAVDL